MTVTGLQLWVYAAGMAALFITPGPVWVALLARSLSGGFAAAWPLAVGVTIGDLLWPLLAIFGMSWILAQFAAVMVVMKWVAVATFLVMGWLLIRHADAGISTDGRLTRPGRWAGFATGVAVVIANPKAMLFYIGVLPGFFDLARLNRADIAAILAISIAIPLAGNLALAASVGRARRFLTSPRALSRANLAAGGLMIVVGLAIAVS